MQVYFAGLSAQESRGEGVNVGLGVRVDEDCEREGVSVLWRCLSPSRFEVKNEAMDLIDPERLREDGVLLSFSALSFSAPLSRFVVSLSRDFAE
jgi:hypothetical protein